MQLVHLQYRREIPDMRTKCTLLILRVRDLIGQEQGQDLLEYSFVVVLIALAAASGMQSVAAGINQIFTNVGSIISTHSQ